MAKGFHKAGTDWPFWILSALVLTLLCIGLGLRVEPRMVEDAGLSLRRSLIPLRYLDLVGVALFLLLVYAAFQRKLLTLMRVDISARVSKEERYHRELEELSSIFGVSSRVNTFRNVEETLQFIAHAARDCLRADRSTLFLVEGEDLVIRAASGRDLRAVKDARMSVGKGVAGWVARHRQPLLINNRRDLEEFYPDLQPERNIDSALCVPLMVKGEALGVLNVNRHSREGKSKFEERHLKLLSVFADYASSSINNVRMYRQISGAHRRLEKSYRELKLVQDQLIQAEKMSAIGQLISEVSHELNNPLTTAVGYAQLLTRVNKDPEVGEYLQIIHEEGIRCQRIIQNLLDFARKNEGEASLVDMNALIRKTVDLRRYQLTIVGVEVELVLDPQVPSCVADSSLLQQVFLNLLNNAEQAMTELDEGGGSVRFQTHYESAGGWIEIEVADDGPGIPEGLEEQIFEPFCTTKPTGKGTGLGLSVCRGILEEMGGEIRAGRAREGGALFSLRLPASSAPAPGEMLPEDGVPVVRGKRILVVDDDPKVRRLLTRTLVLDEHEVETVGGGEEALRCLEQGGFEIVLTDLRMPSMNGIDLYREIRASAAVPPHRVVFFTGGTLSEEHAEFIRKSGSSLIRKPFKLDEVRRTIHAAFEDTSLAPVPTAVSASSER